MERVVVVLDIGKTNKKIALYDQDLKLLDMNSRSFPALPLGNDLRQEQVEAIEQWLLATLKDVAATYDVRAISVTTHGAAAVCVGENGLPAVPVIDYTCEVDEGVHTRFASDIGSPADLQKETLTAEIRPIINVAKLLYFTRERYPEEFAKIQHILLYPQYFAYRLTGKVWADYTYLGCHTYLWDFEAGTWSGVVDRLAIGHLLPSTVGGPGEVAGTITPEVASATGLPPTTPVLVGVHDSNSSLIPYLLTGTGDFILNSTGTWCVAMHPENQAKLRADDIGKTVFYNRSVNNTPVKTAIFLGGLEFQVWTELLQKLNNRKDYPDFNPALAQEILDEGSAFILPGVVQGAGQYPTSRAALVVDGKPYDLEQIQAGTAVPALLSKYEKAYTVLLLSLALHTQAALNQAGLKPGSPIYTEGKFRQTPGYNILLANLFPENPVFITAVEEATSFGAAILGWAAVEGKGINALAGRSAFEKSAISPVPLKGLEAYGKKFFDLVGKKP